jgi:cyclin C
VEEFGVISNTRLINTCSMIVKNKFSYAFSGMDFPYRVAVIQLALTRVPLFS